MFENEQRRSVSFGVDASTVAAKAIGSILSRVSGQGDRDRLHRTEARPRFLKNFTTSFQSGSLPAGLLTEVSALPRIENEAACVD